VDDVPPLADLSKKIIAPFGYRVSTCASSIEALELFNLERAFQHEAHEEKRVFR
jgi:CheY-like chemotaxis protein